MKKLLLTSLLLLGAFTAKAQLATNLSVRTTVDTTTNGVPLSTVNTTANLTVNNAKEKQEIEGVIWRYNNALADGTTTNTLGWYVSNVIVRDRFKELATEKNRIEKQATLDKLTKLLTTDIDLLTAGDLSSLATIAAKLP